VILINEELDQRPDLDTDIAHTGIREHVWEALQTLCNLALLACGERRVGALRVVDLQKEDVI